MILQALNDYYRRKCDDPDPAQRLPAFGLEQKEIPFVLEITTEGELGALPLGLVLLGAVGYVTGLLREKRATPK